MGFCSCTVKYILFLFNFLCALAGLAVLIVGIISLKKTGIFSNVQTADSLHTSAILLIVVGSIVFTIAFFGCCGAIREDSCMITFYGIILLTILVVEISIGIYVVVKKEDAAKQINNGLEDMFNKYWDDPSVQKSIDDIQQTAHCCGYDSWHTYTGRVPTSCCPKQSQCFSQDDYFPKGCKAAVKELIISLGKTLGYVAIGVVAIELIGVISAFCLASSIKRMERRSYA